LPEKDVDPLQAILFYVKFLVYLEKKEVFGFWREKRGNISYVFCLRARRVCMIVGYMCKAKRIKFKGCIFIECRVELGKGFRSFLRNVTQVYT
jgi:hypothetical protein